MFCNKFTLSALVAVAAASTGLAANIPVSDRCQKVLTSMVGDEKLNQCLPIASIVPFLNRDTVSDAASLKSVFTQLCTPKACDQSLISSYSSKIAAECASDLSVIDNPAKVISSVLKMYTPLQKAACYVDQDSQFCMVKNVLAFNINLRNGFPSIQDVFAGAKNVDVCSKCNQHMVGTFMDYISKNPDDTFPITKDQENKVVSVMSQKCGADYAAGISAATSAPFPEVQKKVLQASSAGTASFSALAMFVMAVVTLGARL